MKKYLFLISIKIMFVLYIFPENYSFDWSMETSKPVYTYTGNITLGNGERATFTCSNFQGDGNPMLVIKGDLILSGNAYIGFEPDGESRFSKITLLVTGNIIGAGYNLMIVRRDTSINYIQDNGWRYEDHGYHWWGYSDGYWGWHWAGWPMWIYHPEYRAMAKINDYLTATPSYGNTVILSLGNINLNNLNIYYGWKRSQVRNEYWEWWTEAWSRAGTGALFVGCIGENNISNVVSCEDPSSYIGLYYFRQFTDGYLNTSWNNTDQMNFVKDIAVEYGFDSLAHYGQIFGISVGDAEASIHSMRNGHGSSYALKTRNNSITADYIYDATTSISFSNFDINPNVLNIDPVNLSNEDVFIGNNGKYYISGVSTDNNFNLLINDSDFKVLLLNANALNFYNSINTPDLLTIFGFYLGTKEYPGASLVNHPGGINYNDLFFPDSRINTYNEMISYLYTPMGKIIVNGNDFNQDFNTKLKIYEQGNTIPFYESDNKIIFDTSIFKMTFNKDKFEYKFNFPIMNIPFNSFALDEFHQYNVVVEVSLKNEPDMKKEADIIQLTSINPQIEILADESKFKNNIFSNTYHSDTGWDHINTSGKNMFLTSKIKISRLPDLEVYNMGDLMQNLSGDNTSVVKDNEVLNTFVTDKEVVYDNSSDRYSMYYTIETQFINLQDGLNNLSTLFSVPMAKVKGTNQKTADIMKNVNVVPLITNLPDSVQAIETNNIQLTNNAKQLEQDLWMGDNLNDQRFANISPLSESLSINSFDYNCNLFKLGFSLNTGDFTDNINIIEFKADLRLSTSSTKTKSLYYVIYNSGSTDLIDIYTEDGKVNESDENKYYELTNGKIKKLFAYYKYSDLFVNNTDLSQSVIFPDIFGKNIYFSANGIKVNNHNYFAGEKITADQDVNGALKDNISLKFLQDMFLKNYDMINVESESFRINPNYISNNAAFKTPSFPSRIIVSYSDYDPDNDRMNLYFKPAIRQSQIESYQVVVVNNNSYTNENDAINNFNTSGINSPVNPPDINLSNNNLWTFVDNKYYVSKWIKDNGKSIRLGLPEGADFSLNDKVHFFVKISFISNTSQLSVSDAVRHTSLDMNSDTFYVLLKPEDFLGDTIYKSDCDNNNNQLTIHLNTRFTGDIRIPFGKSIKFGKNSGFPQKKLPNFVIDNNAHFIIAGSMLIDSKNQGKKITFGPSGINTYNEIKQNGMWGGIYILDTGELRVNGVSFIGALDGIVLQNNGIKSRLENLEINNCEIGLHLFNSYPYINTISIYNNLLYGVKEDAMADKSRYNWLFPQVDIKNIIQNGYNYYDYNNGIKK
jgi:hypothetical protein